MHGCAGKSGHEIATAFGYDRRCTTWKAAMHTRHTHETIPRACHTVTRWSCLAAWALEGSVAYTTARGQSHAATMCSTCHELPPAARYGAGPLDKNATPVSVQRLAQCAGVQVPCSTSSLVYTHLRMQGTNKSMRIEATMCLSALPWQLKTPWTRQVARCARAVSHLHHDRKTHFVHRNRGCQRGSLFAAARLPGNQQ